MMHKCLVVIFLAIHCFVSAQNSDSSIVSKQIVDTVGHSPKKAAILSTILPGAGQVYNKKLWGLKVPVIYAGFGAIGYAIHENNKNYIEYRDEYRNRINDTTYVPSGTIALLTNSSVKLRRDEYRRFRDMNLFFLIGWYGLNILEANVTAHLLDFDVSEDLSLRINPIIDPLALNGGVNGLQLRFTF